MRARYRNMVVFLGFFISVNTFANTQNDYSSATAYIASQHLSENIKASVLTANKILPSVPNNPDQKKYYNHPEDINRDAASHVTSRNTVGNVIKDDALMRPKMTVNQQSPEVVFSKKIQNNADAIAEGTYKDCNKKVIIDDSTTQKMCSTSLPFKFDCSKNLHVRIEERWVQEQHNIRLSGHIRLTGRANAYVSTPVETGFVTGISMHVRDGRNPWSCSQSYGLKINGVTVGWYHGHCGKYLGDLQFNVRGVKIPFSHFSVMLTLIGGGLSGNASGDLSLSYQEKQKVPVKTWDSSCASIPASCRVGHTNCLEAGSTKTWDGIPVTASCWKEDVRYQCGGAMSQDCKALENEGCTQVASRCQKQDSGMCQLYDETWSCPNKKTIGVGLQCGQRFYCMDGSCQPTRHEKNKDFGKSVTELSATVSAAEDVKKQGTNPHKDPNSIRIFAGHGAHCRDVVLGALNCCADRGWAKGIFVNCNDEEKNLGHAKEQGGLVVYVGRYCSNKVLGTCLEHKKGYCIFPSHVAYDVQVDGRQGQLHHNFGDGKSPDCSGLSPNDIRKIDFDKVDFSNAIHSVVGRATLPGGSPSQSRIEAHIKKSVAQEQWND